MYSKFTRLSESLVVIVLMKLTPVAAGARLSKSISLV
jgi:hypothetical protein